MEETKNAQIESTMLGFEDHGIFTCFLNLDYGSSAQGFGGAALAGEWCSEYIRHILDTVGVHKWKN